MAEEVALAFVSSVLDAVVVVVLVPLEDADDCPLLGHASR